MPMATLGIRNFFSRKKLSAFNGWGGERREREREGKTTSVTFHLKQERNFSFCGFAYFSDLRVI